MSTTRHAPSIQIEHEFALYNQTLEQAQSAKKPGITILDNLDCGQHVSDISSRATKTHGFLHRHLCLAPGETKEAAYKTRFCLPRWST